MKKFAMRVSYLRAVFICVTLFQFLSCAHNPQPQVSFEQQVRNLNTPELINKYQKANFEWASTSQGGGCSGVDIGVSLQGCSPDFIYHNKGKGNCGAFTTFSVQCLRAAGYEAYPLYVFEQWPAWLAPGHEPRDYHIMTLYKDNGEWFTLDNGKGYPQGIKGPFGRIEDLPYKVLRVDTDYK